MLPALTKSRVVLLLFLMAQACDGVFTYLAVAAHGVTVEANLVLGAGMQLIGPLPTLVGAKLIAVASGLLLHVHGVHRLLAALTLVLVAGAVGPWIVVFGNW